MSFKCRARRAVPSLHFAMNAYPENASFSMFAAAGPDDARHRGLATGRQLPALLGPALRREARPPPSPRIPGLVSTEQGSNASRATWRLMSRAKKLTESISLHSPRTNGCWSTSAWPRTCPAWRRRGGARSTSGSRSSCSPTRSTPSSGSLPATSTATRRSSGATRTPTPSDTPTWSTRYAEKKYP